MEVLVHVLISVAAIGVIWYFAGVLVDNVSRIARRYCKSGFFMAFFILGFFTSVSEFSVAANSLIGKVPEVSVGNLVGASFVILMLLVPLLAVAGRGIVVNDAVTNRTFAFMLAIIAAPALLMLDGNVTRTEGILLVLLYVTMAYVLYRKRVAIQACEPVHIDPLTQMRSTALDLGRIALAGIAVFVGAHFLVEQAVNLSAAFSIPTSLVGVLMLSLGTNIPEIVIALRSLARATPDIAFGNYLGSAAMNTLIFGMLAIGSGTFLIEPSVFFVTTTLFVTGIVFLFIFARSHLTITRKEGIFLFLFYAAFLLFQFWNIAKFAAE
jgi:cation:H+ antiporter